MSWSRCSSGFKLWTGWDLMRETLLLKGNIMILLVTFINEEHSSFLVTNNINNTPRETLATLHSREKSVVLALCRFGFGLRNTHVRFPHLRIKWEWLGFGFRCCKHLQQLVFQQTTFQLLWMNRRHHWEQLLQELRKKSEWRVSQL